MATEGTLQVLTPGIGYGLIAGLGVAFAIIMVFLTLIQNRYGEHNTFKSTEEFNAASRSIKPGMISAGIVSSWTHATTLLTSCTLSYSYGVSGGLWYGAAGTFQTLLFAVTAYKIKEQSNNAHTFPEIVMAKHGRLAHKIFTVFGLITNVINGSALLTGGCGVFNELTGMNIWASYFILIIVVQAYIVVGGLRSTFICDYLHTTFLFVVILIFMFTVYTTSPIIGSPSALYDLLVKQSAGDYPADSYNNSYFTVRSRDCLVFGATILLGGFSGVWTDQAYWQRAIASDPHTAVEGYVLGSFSWYAIPFAMSTCMGLAAAALQGTEAFPVTLTADQVSSGLAAPAAAIALLGKSGACLIIVLLFMAVTSSTSAESIAASSLITFDIYKAYINPAASTRKLLWTSIVGLFIYGIVLAAVSCIFHSVGISLGWLVKIFGCLMGGGSFPMVAIVLWDRTSTLAAQVSPILGLVSGLTAWMVTTKARSGVINIITTGDSLNSLAGDCVSLGVGLVSVVVLSYAFPKKSPFLIEGVEADLQPTIAQHTNDGGNRFATIATADHEKTPAAVAIAAPQSSTEPISALTPQQTHVQKILALSALAFGTLGFLILLPFTLYGTGYTFSKGFFTAYVVVAFVWIWTSSCICVLLPVWEARRDLVAIVGRMMGGKRV